MLLPIDLIIDPHHHFVDPQNNEFQKSLKKLNVSSYLPSDYNRESKNLPILKTVHIEATPDDGLLEVLWISRLAKENNLDCKVGRIVANCDLSSSTTNQQLHDLVQASSLVCGIRIILDYDGEYNGGQNATNIACAEHNNDYLRDLRGPSQRFEQGFALLEKYNLSFDLQCCPAQLPAAFSLCSRHPNINVCIDHMGKVRGLTALSTAEDEQRLIEWRVGMKLMSTLPQVYVKLSMLGYCVFNWYGDTKKEQYLKSLVREVIALFGPNRCMFASNWWGPISNSDQPEDHSPTMQELYLKFYSWVSDMSSDDQMWLFAGTAAKFYKIDLSSTSSSSLTVVTNKNPADNRKAKILVAGAGWWSQGWHLPLLHRLSDRVIIAGIIEPTFQPRSTLVKVMLNTDELQQKYNTKVYATIDEFLALSPHSIAAEVDGIIICTPHSTHAEIGVKAIEQGWHVLCEKPMTTDVVDARTLAEAAIKSQTHKIFAINNSANWRSQTRDIYERIVHQQVLGQLTFVSAFFGVDLGWLFEDPRNTGWNCPSGNMVGNGLCWGQLSHTLAWVYKVTGLVPESVFAMLGHSTKTGADIHARYIYINYH